MRCIKIYVKEIELFLQFTTQFNYKHLQFKSISYTIYIRIPQFVSNKSILKQSPKHNLLFSYDSYSSSRTTMQLF